MPRFTLDHAMRTLTSLFVLLLALLAFVVPATAEPEAPAPSTPTTEVPDEPESPAPAEMTERDKILSYVAEMRKEAARIRGLEWKFDVPVDLLTRDQLRERMVQMMEEEVTPEERERDTRIMRRMGLIGPDEDPYEMMKEALQEMVAGFYDPEKKCLFLIEGLSGEGQKPVLLHELIHALEDQYIDLKARSERYKEDGDKLFAEKCLGEGSAEHAVAIYLKENPRIRRLFLEGQRDPEQARRQMKVMAKIPAFMILPTMMHYDLGPAFVRRAVGDEFPGGMDRLYENGPVSQEQLLHPSKWFGEMQDWPQEVVWSTDFATLLGDGWKKVHDLPAGELDLAFFLDFFLGGNDGKVNLRLLQQGKKYAAIAEQAAAGWDGGRSYFLEKEGLPAAWVEAQVFDTIEDAAEAYDAILDAVKAMNGESFRLHEDEAVALGENVRAVHFEGAYGHGRMMQRGDQILSVDGLPLELLDKVWPEALKTTFVKDERDTWDPTKVVDPFEGLDLADKTGGWGIELPADGWTVERAPGPMGQVARASKNGVSVRISVVPAPVDALRPMLESQLKAAGVPVGTPVDVKLAGHDAVRWAPPGSVIYLGGVGSRSVILMAQGSGDGLAELLSEIDALAEAMVLAEE